MTVVDVAAYFPDRPPTWLKVGITLLAVLTVGGRFLDGAVSLPAVVAGFLLFAVAIGPGAASGVGKRVGQWFRGIGTVRRTLVIVSFAVAVAVLYQFGWVPVALLGDAASGGLLAVAVFVCVHAERAGGIDGWTADRPG